MTGDSNATVVERSFMNVFTLEFWLAKKFILHRINGLVYLLLYIMAIANYIYNYEGFLKKPYYLLPICGCLQAVIAAFTFTFLPRTKASGYVAMGDKGALSYIYVLENTFFSGQLMMAWLYMDDRFFYPLFRKWHILELLIVFLPHMPFVRGLWPKSSFRASYGDEKRISSKNIDWFNMSTLITKIFYMFAKHYIGFFLHYMRYLGRMNAEEQRAAYGLYLGGCWGTTIAIFIHTLKFKGYISARTGGVVYQISFPWMIYYFAKLFFMLSQHTDVLIISTLGLILNHDKFTKPGRPVWHIYQVIVMAIMTRGVVHNLF